MRRKICMLLFVLGITAVCLGGVLSPPAQASCTHSCYQPGCGVECCTLTDCTVHCYHVICV